MLQRQVTLPLPRWTRAARPAMMCASRTALRAATPCPHPRLTRAGPAIGATSAAAVIQRFSRFSSSSSAAFTPSPPLQAPFSNTDAAVASSGGAGPSTPNTYELDFDDVSQSFSVKSSLEIWRSLFVFRMCAIKPLVRNARTLLTLSERVLGRPLTHWVLRKTFFGHFCAGETAEEVAVVIARLERSGLGGILDYAAEADVSAVQPAAAAANAAEDSEVVVRDRTGIQSARTYDYAGEQECDANALICQSCIEAAGARGDGQGFAAIKLTALGKPELLEHLSKILTETKKLFVAFANDPEHAAVGIDPSAASASASTPTPASAAKASPTSSASANSSSSSNNNPNPSICVSNLISYPRFLAGLRAIGIPLEEHKCRRLFDMMDRDRSGSVDFLEWVSFLDPKLLGGLSPKFRSAGLPTLAQHELEKVWAMIARLERLAQLASERKVKLMVDAEQTYFQPAIDHLVLDLQRKYNKTHPVIFNTYQCYLHDSASRVTLDLERSRREGFVFAAKAVRGAYMVQERRRAGEMGYEDPIQPTLQATHDNYHKVVSTILSAEPKAHLMVATHNETTVRYVTGLMAARGIPRSGGGVFFGQLLGMCDHVSFSLGRCGYAVYKYVPYGPIHDVLPYLIRRAEENSDMLGGAAKERVLLWNELKRRYKAALLGSATAKVATPAAPHPPTASA